MYVRVAVLLGSLLTAFGLFLAGFIVLAHEAAEIGQAFEENPSPNPWDLSDWFMLLAVGGIPVLAGILFLLSAWFEDRAQIQRANLASRTR